MSSAIGQEVFDEFHDVILVHKLSKQQHKYVVKNTHIQSLNLKHINMLHHGTHLAIAPPMMSPN